MNQSLLQENNRIKSQFAGQEEDRNFLIEQLVSVKKDNARLRSEYEQLELQYEALKSHSADESIKRDSTNTINTTVNIKKNESQNKNDTEDRYKEVNIRIRKILAEERKSLQQVRQNYAQELKTRTEMEMLLRQCVDDVRKEIARRHMESSQFSQGTDLAKMYHRQPGLIPVEEFTQEDRERALELLLSQERVVTLLYTKAFPINNLGTKGGNMKSVSGIDSEDITNVSFNNGDTSESKSPTNSNRPNTTSKLPLVQTNQQQGRPISSGL